MTRIKLVGVHIIVVATTQNDVLVEEDERSVSSQSLLTFLLGT